MMLKWIEGQDQGKSKSVTNCIFAGSGFGLGLGIMFGIAFGNAVYIVVGTAFGALMGLAIGESIRGYRVYSSS